MRNLVWIPGRLDRLPVLGRLVSGQILANQIERQINMNPGSLFRFAFDAELAAMRTHDSIAER